MAEAARVGLETFDLPPLVPGGKTVVEVAAARSAGRATPGTMGVSLSAAGDFIRRQKALQEQRRRPVDRSDDDDDDPPDNPPPHLTVIQGEGVTVRG